MSIFVGAAGYFMALVLAQDTLIDMWMPFSVSAILAIATVAAIGKFWRKVTSFKSFWLNCLFHAVIMTGFLSGLFYTLNFCFADEATLHNETVLVDRKYYKVRHKSVRISRKVYRQGEAYKEYFIKVRFNNGRTANIPLSYEQQRRLRVGMNIDIPVVVGLFDVSVIKRREIVY